MYADDDRRSTRSSRSLFFNILFVISTATVEGRTRKDRDPYHMAVLGGGGVDGNPRMRVLTDSILISVKHAN